MVTRKPLEGEHSREIGEPNIERQQILVLEDEDFTAENVCIVTGCATAIAAAVNGLTVLGLDINAEEGERTRKLAQAMGGMSRVKEMMTPIEVGNLFVHGFSRFSRYLVGGDLLFDGGMVLTY